MLGLYCSGRIYPTIVVTDLGLSLSKASFATTEIDGSQPWLATTIGATTDTMKKIIFLLLLLFLSTVTFAGEDIDSLFQQGNDFYKKGNYSQAIASYRKILDSGVKNAKVFYNLGNAYFKNNEIGRAVLSYKRAYRLSPKDSDIKFNLEYVLSFVSEEAKKTPIEKLLENLYNLLTLNELTIVIFLIYTALFISLSVYIFTRKRVLFWANITLGIILILSG
ncbi:unnamed protein product, partial [marine sediment metagenome]